jgi:hypothetical protein
MQSLDEFNSLFDNEMSGLGYDLPSVYKYCKNKEMLEEKGLIKTGGKKRKNEII